VDLDHDQHLFLRRFALDSGTDATVVVRVLLALLAEDAAIARRVIEHLAAPGTT
jgi:hypothetical protein